MAVGGTPSALVVANQEAASVPDTGGATASASGAAGARAMPAIQEKVGVGLGSPGPDIPQHGAHVPLGRCVFDCGPPRPYTHLTNTATQASPRWMCNPCNMARKAIEGFARKKDNKEMHKAIQDLKKHDIEEWKVTVRSARVRTKDDYADPKYGVRDLIARNALVVKSTRKIMQSTSLSSVQTLDWKDKDKYAAWFKNVRGRSGINLDDDVQKKELFDAILADQGQVRRIGHDGEMQILVDEGDVIQGTRSRAFIHEVDKTAAIESAGQLNDAMAEMASQGASQTPFSGEEKWGPAGKVFSAQIAERQTPSGNQLFGDTPKKSAPPPATDLISAMEWAPYGCDSGGTRTLKANPSDPMQPSAKKPRAASSNQATALGNRLGISGVVLETHMEAKSIWAKVKKDYGNAKTHPEKLYNQWKNTFKGDLGDCLDGGHPAFKQTVDAFNQAYKDIQDWAEQRSATWDATSCRSQLIELDRKRANLEELHVAFMDILVKAREDAKSTKDQRKHGKIKAAKEVERIARAYTSANTPGNVARWLTEKRAFGIISETNQESEDLAEDEDSQAAQANPVSVRQNSTFHLGSMRYNTLDDISLDVPSAFSEDHPGGTTLKKLKAAMGSRITPTVIDILRKAIENEKDSVEYQSEVTGVAQLRMPAKGGTSDTLEAAAWTPQVWRDENIIPEALRDEGSPWLLAGRPGSTRYKNTCWPIPGHGQFLAVIKGPVILLTIPYKDIMARGRDAETALEWFCEDVSYSIFVDMADKGIQAITLATGATAWIPFGWAAILVSLGWSSEYTYVLSAPFVNSKVAARHSGILNMVESWERILQTRPMTPTWTPIMPKYMAYFQTLRQAAAASQAVAAAVAPAAPAAPPPPPPIQDKPAPDAAGLEAELEKVIQDSEKQQKRQNQPEDKQTQEQPEKRQRRQRQRQEEQQVKGQPSKDEDQPEEEEQQGKGQPSKDEDQPEEDQGQPSKDEDQPEKEQQQQQQPEEGKDQPGDGDPDDAPAPDDKGNDEEEPEQPEPDEEANAVLPAAPE